MTTEDGHFTGVRNDLGLVAGTSVGHVSVGTEGEPRVTYTTSLSKEKLVPIIITQNNV